MRVAALYDIHGNLPALSAVLADVAREGVDAVVIGGDVAAGPQPRETLELLSTLGPRAYFVRGNADREVVDAYDQRRGGPAQGSGPVDEGAAFAAARVTSEQRDFLAGFRPTVALDVDGLGAVLFCHGSPRSDTEIITSQTSPERLSRILQGVSESLIVGGHTHRQFVHSTGTRRFVNAGSVGLPYEGRPGAFWALLGPEVNLRCTEYDVSAAAEQLRETGYPAIDEMLNASLLEPTDPEVAAAFFEAQASAQRN